MSVLKFRDPTTNEWKEIIAIQGPQGPEGPQGPQGIPGETGPQGPKGQDGTMSFEDLTPEQKATLKGDTGPVGPQGPKGDKGDTGAVGPQGEQGPKGDPFTYSDFTESQLEALRGPQGIQGETGPQGPQGIQGPAGRTPVKGTDYFTEADKTELLENYYTKTAVNELLEGLTAGINLQIVETLPTENIDTNTIYLVLRTEAFLNDYYDEYIYINSRWELIGNTRVDLNGVTAADVSYENTISGLELPTVQDAIHHLLSTGITEARVNELINAAFGNIINAEEVSY